MKYKSLIILLLYITIRSGDAQPQHKWELVLDVYPTEFTGIDNYDSLNIMAIANHFGANRRIYKSTDGGISWDSVFVESDTIRKFHPAKDISYPTKDFCIVACDEGMFLKTTDGGSSWNAIQTEPDSFDLFKVSMYDENHGVICRKFDLLISHDGFETWERLTMPSSPMLPYSIQMISPFTLRFLAVQYENSPNNFIRYFESKDGGIDWTEYEFQDIRFPIRMKFIDSLFGYTCGRVRTGTVIEDMTEYLEQQMADKHGRIVLILLMIHLLVLSI